MTTVSVQKGVVLSCTAGCSKYNVRKEGGGGLERFFEKSLFFFNLTN